LFQAQESLDSFIDRRSAYYRASRRAEQEAAAQAEQEAALPPPQPLLTPPNILTLLRVVLVPVFVVTWYSTGGLSIDAYDNPMEHSMMVCRSRRESQGMAGSPLSSPAAAVVDALIGSSARR